VPESRLKLGQAVSMLHPRDGRAVFAIPWEGVTIVGTTDVDHKGGMEGEPSISEDERAYILESLAHAFPKLELGERDVTATWSGVRGVINTGAADPSKESREHALWKEDGLLTVTGGKLTTFRVMAIQTLRAARAQIPEVKQLRRARILDDVGELEAGALPGFEGAARERLLGRHGRDSVAIASLPERTELVQGTNVLWSEVRFAARDEAVVHLEDLLLRRARVGLLAKNGGMDEVTRIKTIVQEELGWDEARWAREEAAYRAKWQACYAPSPSSKQAR
jgi:glycerol-3-phosphate dehydrogenase